ncbi:MAG: YolD-like family protein [Lachnospiraceae bacterium]|nr:YolD-like family protein [Lachnospiraceae bacterium]
MNDKKIDGTVRKNREIIKTEFPYEDIVNLPHPVSHHHVPMPLLQRAAQFAPFAALTGYDEVIEETARQTDDRVTLSESEIVEIDRKLQVLEEMMEQGKEPLPEVSVTYFLPDQRKEGGSYQNVKGRVEKIDLEHQRIVMHSGEMIYMGQIIRMDGDI